VREDDGLAIERDDDGLHALLDVGERRVVDAGDADLGVAGDRQADVLVLVLGAFGEGQILARDRLDRAGAVWNARSRWWLGLVTLRNSSCARRMRSP
jgi:hypothetical protein